MNKPGVLCGWTAAICLLFASATLASADISSGSIPQTLSVQELRKAIQETQSALDQLPKRLIRESGGTLGHRTQPDRIKDKPVWLEVDLGKKETFDLLVLIPMVMIDEDQNQSDIGFPSRYKIMAFDNEKGGPGQVLFDSAGHPGANQPNRAPILIQCPGASARRVRMIASVPTQDPISGTSVFALAEMMVFDGQNNRALGKPVKASIPLKTPPLYQLGYVTDGYMPFSQPGTKEKTKNNLGMVWQNHPPIPAKFILDLGREFPIDEVRLYPVHLGYNFSVFHRTGLGFPLQFSIDVSNQADFKTFTTLFQTGGSDYPPPGHRLAMFSDGIHTGRYVRVVASKLPLEPKQKKPIMAFSEIEVLSDGIPVSLHAHVVTSGGKDTWWKSSPQHLSDGRSSHGKIPLLRDWLTLLSERSQLELNLNSFEQELTRKTLVQSKRLRHLSWIMGLGIPLFAIVFLVQRLIRLKQVTSVREELAADLHDEIGGNLSGIALLCDQLTGDPDFPGTYFPKLEKIANTSRESAQNTRNLVQLLESDQIQGELIEKMEASAELMLAQLSYRFDIQGAKYIQKLPPKEKWHLLLFFKEALANIVKHADASEVILSLSLTSRHLVLSISDNGRGIDKKRNGSKLPVHLQARAQKLQAEVSIASSPETGTTIILKKKL